MKKSTSRLFLLSFTFALALPASLISEKSSMVQGATEEKSENTSLVQLWIRNWKDNWDGIFVDVWARNSDWVQVAGSAVSCNPDAALTYDNQITTTDAKGATISLISSAYQYANEGGDTLCFVGASGTGLAGTDGEKWKDRVITAKKGMAFPSYQYTNNSGSAKHYTLMAEQRFSYSYTDGNGSLVFTPIPTTMDNEIASISTQECFDSLPGGKEDHHIRLYITMIKGDWTSAPNYSSESAGIDGLNIASHLLVDGAPAEMKKSYNYNFTGANSLLLILTNPKDTFKTITFLKGCQFYSYSAHTTGEDKVYSLPKQMTFDKGDITITDDHGDNSYGYTERTYLTTFLNADGSVLQSGKTSYLSLPVYEGETPVKAMSQEFTYVFSGWTPALVEATADASYTATFSSSSNTYLVIFANYDDTVLQMGELAYGTLPVYTGNTPSRPNDAYGSYSYLGWDKPLTTVNDQIVYYAKYQKTANTVNIRFLNFDGSLIANQLCDYGDVPVYKGDTPTREAKDEKTAYEFSGWSPVLSEATADSDYTATFKEVARQYTVSYYVGDTLLSSTSVAYGSTLSKPADPSKEGYRFTGWTLNGVAFDFTTPVTTSISLKAEFAPLEDNKAVIGWSIGGGIAGILLIGALVFVLIRKKKKV